MPRGYQSFKQKSTRDVYCSSTEFKNHDEAKAWVSRCLEHFAIPASDTKDYEYPLDSQPRGAIIWPSDDTSGDEG